MWGSMCGVNFVSYVDQNLRETSNKLLFGRGSQNYTSMDSDSWTESDIVAGTEQAVHIIREYSTIFLGPKTFPR